MRRPLTSARSYRFKTCAHRSRVFESGRSLVRRRSLAIVDHLIFNGARGAIVSRIVPRRIAPSIDAIASITRPGVPAEISALTGAGFKRAASDLRDLREIRVVVTGVTGARRW